VRPVVAAFARDVAENLEPAGPVVELGARVAEGQDDPVDLRSMYPAADYLGCDLYDGPGVDQLEDIHHLSFADNSIGTVLCLETLEHVADPLRAVQEIHRVLKPGGLCVVSSVMLFPIHAHPWDYWRFTPEGFRLLLAPFDSSLVMAHGWEPLPEGVFGVAYKGVDRPLTPAQLPRLDLACRTWAQHQPVEFGPIRMTLPELWRHTLRYSTAAARHRLSRHPS
jgi:SAM-dependent methyltransferase